jgi:hypothetical protein
VTCDTTPPHLGCRRWFEAATNAAAASAHVIVRSPLRLAAALQTNVKPMAKMLFLFFKLG